MKVCSVDGCDKKLDSKGYCNKHYMQIRRHGVIEKSLYDMTLKEKFNLKFKVNGNTGCHDWHAVKNSDGYGMIKVNSRMHMAHRISYILNYGEISDGLCVCHNCDNRSCVNVNHLFLGTHKENMLDRDRKGRGNQGRGEAVASHKLNENNIRALRGLWGCGMKLSIISALFHISSSNAFKIAKRESWRHVK